MTDIQSSQLCDVVVAQLKIGVVRCNDHAVATAKCEEYPACQIDHPVCAAHAHKESKASE